MYLEKHTCLNNRLGCKPQSAIDVHKTPLNKIFIFCYMSRFRLSLSMVLKWLVILITFVNAIIPSQLFAQKAEGSQKAEDVIQEKQPITAYWIKNLFFTRGLNLRNELWDLKGTGAFRARWRFIYSNPLGPRFSLQLDVPVGLVAPVEGRNVAGLGDVYIQFQGAASEKKLWKQIAGIGVYLPTGTHTLLGGDLTTISPRYQVDYIGNEYLIPCFLMRYFHSVIEQDGAHELRVLRLEPFITFPRIAPHFVDLSASVELEWDFNFVADLSGGTMIFGLSKQINPQTAIHIEFAPGVSDYFRKTIYEWRYDVDVLMTF
jgi:hypothetical protein